jgi:ribosomal protein S18 acetylase RimI-like enzyme
MVAAASRFIDRGFDAVLEEPPDRMVLQSRGGQRVDLNGLVYRADGHSVQVDHEGDLEIFPAWGWVQRAVAGQRVVCLSAEAQRLKHRGYPPRRTDETDLAAIAHINEPPRFDPAVRPMEAGEEDLVAGIETASDRLLRPFGMWPLPPSHPEAIAAERARTVAVLVAGRPSIGFSRLELVDGHAHIGQLSVLSEYGRLGIGASLVEASCQWASRHGNRLITLTTFVEVPFNAPWYRRIGFRELPDALDFELAEVVAQEADLAAFGARVVMARTLG